MKGHGKAFSGDDCFAQFDEAFARLEAAMVAVETRPKEAVDPAQPQADLSEFEEAFTDIDRQLAAHAAVEPAAAEAATPVETQSEPVREAAAARVSAPASAPAATPPATPPPVPSAAPAAAPNVAPHAVPTAAPPAATVPRATLALVPQSPVVVGDTALAESAAPVDRDQLWRRTNGTSTPLERLVNTVHNLLWLQRAVQSSGARVRDRMRWEHVADVFADTRQLCADFDLQSARVRADFALVAFEEGRLDGLASEIGELVRHIRHDLQTCSIWPIPRDRVWAFNLSLAEDVKNAFPSAATDVAEAGRCMGFGVSSAAIFHLLRAADYARRALAQAIRRDQHDAEAQDWRSTIAALEARVNDLTTWPAGPARKAAKDFFTAMLNDARTMDDTRRRVAVGETFAERHALTVWFTTRDFLARAAERLSEAQDTPLTSDDFIA